MTDMLTKKFLCENRVAFFPASMGEAKYIQKRLFALGLGWIDNGKTLYDGDACVSSGIVVDGGKIYTLGISDDRAFIVATVADLSATFNPQAGKIAALEQKVEKLAALLEPKASTKLGVTRKA